MQLVLLKEFGGGSSAKMKRNLAFKSSEEANFDTKTQLLDIFTCAETRG